ncbi:translation elongation factor eef-1b gamma subunit [Diplodia corticola]|uniref:Translation elongation factor eef-1b gamma subunit n=1 Tax=Diplodia corticola TaxID=236234 RepID=A0A1J9R441_9PEZI|nr:translation elongation factor eef-1b gamma subunit [Diplodia corticola]OJD35376.1 translation elongation factor eef-1b gamma subunit [Diplodia corticola]
MAPIGKIYTYPDNPRVQKVQAVARLNGLQVDEVPDFKMGTTNKTAEFLAKFPTGKVPAFEGADGVNLLESDAIMQYVAESGPKAAQLVGSTPAEKARVQQWVCFQVGEVWPEVLKLLYPRFGIAKYDDAVEQPALEKLGKGLAAVERALEGGRKWLATDALSMADLAVMSSFVWAFKFGVDEEQRKKYPKAMEWFFRTLHSEGVKEAFPKAEQEMCTVRQIPQ